MAVLERLALVSTVLATQGQSGKPHNPPQVPTHCKGSRRLVEAYTDTTVCCVARCGEFALAFCVVCSRILYAGLHIAGFVEVNT